VLFRDVSRHSIALLLILEFRRVDTDCREPARRVTFERGPDPGRGACAVDSAKGPHVQQDDTALQVAHSDGLAHPA
jgi:hypothetical protein